MVRLRSLRSRGFTLVESIIILFIFCLIFTIPTIKFNNFKSDLEFRNTTRLVKSIIESSTRKSLLNKRAIFIDYAQTKSCILVRQGKKIEKFSVSRDIKIVNLDNVYVNKKGTISPRTITISNKVKTSNIKLQMKWGRMIED